MISRIALGWGRGALVFLVAYFLLSSIYGIAGSCEDGGQIYVDPLSFFKANRYYNLNTIHVGHLHECAVLNFRIML